MTYTTCPVAVNKAGEAYKACGEELQASRVEWTRGVTIGDDGMVEDFGEFYAFAHEGEDATRFYCADDHSAEEIRTALNHLQAEARR